MCAVTPEDVGEKKKTRSNVEEVGGANTSMARSFCEYSSVSKMCFFILVTPASAVEADSSDQS